MNFEQIIYQNINKTYFAFKTLNLFSFDNDVKNFWIVNNKIENIAQLEEMRRLLLKCVEYNLIAVEDVLKQLIIESDFYEKIVKAFVSNTNLLNNIIEENIQKIFVVAYQENKDFVITNSSDLTKIIANFNSEEYSKLTKKNKEEYLIDLINSLRKTKNRDKLTLELKSKENIIIMLIESIKLI
ncbi:hypothetical protein CK556_03530 [Mesoplasma chauliocola]|uniref:Uncharacterized protein n=1 Tax=Mesoplasma chauliocola TaxID=216427 RepID=A0A249SP48_9MOLU|nr:hypothetical protein [Mesoplasma chauliocola]ASZ09397.1 hypothetical protein CK556_03530 [Mesoplasma chauliocola]